VTRAQVTLEQRRPNVEVTLDNLRSARPDLLILDVVLFRSDAQVLLEAMAADADLAQLPVLTASTSVGAAEHLAKSYPMLVRDVLPKPFDVGGRAARHREQARRVGIQAQ
jgi:DNA-binding response OmpR family regulator